VKAPGIGGQIGGYRGKLRQARIPMRDQGEGFTGFKKSRRPEKGGGSRSGKGWNNQGVPVQVRTPRSNIDVGGFQGRIKRGDRRMVDQGEAYTGHIKAHRREKGGGSVSGKLWNNRESSLPRRTLESNIGGIPQRLRTKQKPRVDQGEEFTGVIKARRPVKGGGSVSGKLWNNDERPIQVKTPSEDALKQVGFTGKIKHNPMRSKFRDQGEEFTGVIKRKRSNYGQNELAVKESTLKRKPLASAYEAEGIQVSVRRRTYVKNKNSAEDALMKLKPTKATNAVAGLHVRVERRPYIRNKNSAEDALLKLKPTKTTQQLGELHVKVKQFHYVRNPSGAKGSLKVREPGKAFARATDYQGNIKMRKFILFEKNRALHPDARFVRTNKNNVDEERDVFTNFKLWWARLFKKEETQPEHLKEKGRKPRYDNGEQGMWYD
jgi:hypothetical protein